MKAVRVQEDRISKHCWHLIATPWLEVGDGEQHEASTYEQNHANQQTKQSNSPPAEITKPHCVTADLHNVYSCSFMVLHFQKIWTRFNPLTPTVAMVQLCAMPG